MLHIAQLVRTSADARSPSKPAQPSGVAPHWLLRTIYGRGMLEAALRKARPDLTVPVWRHAPELDGVLDDLVDQLGLRAWRKPLTFQFKLRYLRLAVAMRIAVAHAPAPHLR